MASAIPLYLPPFLDHEGFKINKANTQNPIMKKAETMNDSLNPKKLRANPNGPYQPL
jgi:hypothetical protein